MSGHLATPSRGTRARCNQDERAKCSVIVQRRAGFRSVVDSRGIELWDDSDASLHRKIDDRTDITVRVDVTLSVCALNTHGREGNRFKRERNAVNNVPMPENVVRASQLVQSKKVGSKPQ